MNNRKVKCFRAADGQFVGYLGTSSATVCLVDKADDSSLAWCKWVYRDGGLYLSKDTDPGDRWLGQGNEPYADWGIGKNWYAPVIVNPNNTVVLQGDTSRYLYGPYNSDTKYVCWSKGADNVDILQIELRNLSEWLKDVPDTTLIGDINLPGTHDSAAFTSKVISWIGTLWACHDEDITDQLMNGVRLLDVRLKVKPENGGFVFGTCHGSVSLGVNAAEYQSFMSLMDECNAFLAKNGSEFIAMSLKVDDWTSVVANPEAPTAPEIVNIKAALEALKVVLASYPIFSAPLAMRGQMPALKKVRKQIYLLDRITPALVGVSQTPYFGGQLGITGNTSGELLSRDSSRSFDIYVQDKYEDLDISDPGEEKFRLFKDAIPKKPQGGILFNFASATRLKLLGVYIQEKVVGFIDADRPAILGWSLYDYESKSAQTADFGLANSIEMVVASNFGYKY